MNHEPDNTRTEIDILEGTLTEGSITAAHHDGEPLTIERLEQMLDRANDYVEMDDKVADGLKFAFTADTNGQAHAFIKPLKGQLICPEPGTLFKTSNDTCYFRAGWRTPIRRVTHKEMPTLMTRRQIKRNVSRSKFIIKHGL